VIEIGWDVKTLLHTQIPISSGSGCSYCMRFSYCRLVFCRPRQHISHEVIEIGWDVKTLLRKVACGSEGEGQRYSALIGERRDQLILSSPYIVIRIAEVRSISTPWYPIGLIDLLAATLHHITSKHAMGSRDHETAREHLKARREKDLTSPRESDVRVRVTLRRVTSV
jgi:hypothetical protein